MRSKLPFYFLICFLIVTFLQFIAALDGIMHFFGLHWVFAFFASILLVFVPAIGPLAGVYGAVAAWGWSLWAALLLFFGPYALYGFLYWTGVKVPLTFWKIQAYRPSRPVEIEAEYKIIDPDDK